MNFLSWNKIVLTAENPPPLYWPLSQFPLIIIVGLTGVGKSTVVKLLPKSGGTYTMLPDRREMTDKIIIATLQKEAGQTVQIIADRVERFNLTARYRAKYPGGMVHALSQLAVASDQVASFLIFDGLRGLHEVQHAVTFFPQARFVVLDAPDLVRLKRLMKRADSFDTTTIRRSLTGYNLMATLLNIPDIEAVFDEAQLRQIARVARTAKISTETVLKRVTIIVEERRNYDSNTARVHLTHTLPSKQVLVINTDVLPAEMVAQQVADWLGV